jgi:hypothetical protein
MPPDLAAHIEELKKNGATESAYGDLLMIAGILVGDTILSFPKDPITGEYGMSYRNKVSYCPRPGLPSSELATMRAEAEKRIRPVLDRLRKIADADHSGFVSTAEGSHLRRVFEFGARLAAVAEHEGHEQPQLQKILHVSPEDFASLLSSYRELVVRLADLHGLSIPVVPASLRATPSGA